MSTKLVIILISIVYAGRCSITYKVNFDVRGSESVVVNEVVGLAFYLIMIY